jgi:tRNA pseudouridine32 synthase/23S rRNA pseudouridine746 synthase
LTATSRLSILYEDGRIIAVDKPSGSCVIQPRRREAGKPLVELVVEYLGAKAWTVHRIDKGTSGVVLFAKDAETHRELSKAFERREVKKTYLALVEGEVASRGVVRSPLKDRGSGRVSVHLQGKAAETRYEPLERQAYSGGALRPSGQGGKALLEVIPLTGRRHQVRVHLYSIGHRVVGDPLYGKKRGDEGRLMLHAWKLELPPGPWGEARQFTSPPPEGFRAKMDSSRQ